MSVIFAGFDIEIETAHSLAIEISSWTYSADKIETVIEMWSVVRVLIYTERDEAE